MDFILPISVKGIIVDNNQVLLLKNERNEWELPGGRLEVSEKPEECVIREIHEELGINCIVDNIIDSWVFEVFQGKYVFIVTYLCKCNDTSNVLISEEHLEYSWVQLKDLENVFMPEGYKQSIKKAVLHNNSAIKRDC
jgi:mutator protein MutT